MSISQQPIDRQDGDSQGTVHPSSSQDEGQSNADLYAPPAYTIESSAGEERLDAEAFVPEKTPLLREGQPSHPADEVSPLYTPETASTRNEEHTPSRTMPARKPVDWANYSDNATRCSVLTDRPATWTVKKKKGMALCPLAAAVLVREGILNNKDLVLAQSLLERPTSPSSLLNPTDPLSAVIVSTYDVLGDILIGAAGGPLEVARQIGPARSSSLRREDLARQSQDLLCHGDGAKSKNDTLMVGPKALVHYCSGTYKGVRKIVETGLKTPMTYTHSLTRGFHNMPGLYGERLREHEEIVDMKSGFAVSGKALGYGIYDGIKDFFVMPIKGAQKEGVAGAGKGFCKGLGNMMCNMGEAGCGIIGYSSYGIYKELQKASSSGNVSARNVVLTLGEAELTQAREEERRDVVKRWLQVQMRPN